MEDNMKKKHVSLLLAAAMAASVISGCGSSANNSTAETTKAEGAAAETTAAGETETTAEAVEDTEKTRQMRLSSRLRVMLCREAAMRITAGKALMYGKLSQQTTVV